MHDHRRLRVWQAANAFSVAIYSATKSFPIDERYALTTQMRKAAVSIQSNIAEGCGRGTRADTARFLQLSIGSIAEVSSQLHLSRDLGYLTPDAYVQLDAKAIHIRHMLVRLLRTLRPG